MLIIIRRVSTLVACQEVWQEMEGKRLGPGLEAQREGT